MGKAARAMRRHAGVAGRKAASKQMRKMRRVQRGQQRGLQRPGPGPGPKCVSLREACRALAASGVQVLGVDPQRQPDALGPPDAPVVLPVPDKPITQPRGLPLVRPKFHVGGTHVGRDVPGKVDEPVRALAEGVVEEVGATPAEPKKEDAR